VAERISNLTPLRGRRSRYPWGEWMDGSAWRIRRGVDFEVSAESMAQHIRNRARDRGMSAHARLVDDGEAVEFQITREAA
jgi:hypothetical protein